MTKDMRRFKAKVTAGLRGSGWNAARMDRPYSLKAQALNTADGQRTLGLLYSTTGREKTVVCTMHPREFSGTPYLVPDVLDAHCACWVQAPRSIGNDLRLEHELAILDVAAALTYLKQKGFERIILLGISGGASLYALYTQQALRTPEMRLDSTSAGRPIHLLEAEMPAPDGLIFVSPHPGPGKLLMNGIDPSVIDENDPFSVDTSLDPFSAANGFNQPPNSSSYDPSFIVRYRQSQTERVKRLDERAKAALAVRMEARNSLKKWGDAEPPTYLKMQAAYTPIFQLWRTDADLRSWDISIDPSDRQVGTLWGRDPYISNFGSVGFARLITPESWLSTWSGLSSIASFERCGPELNVPTLMLEYTGDQAAFPSDMDAIFNSIGSTRKERYRVRGNHHGMALQEGEESGQLIAGRYIQEWLSKQCA